MSAGRARIAASILNADLANLAEEVRRAVKAGADRIHFDVMDGHFVPNITFGPGTLKEVRRLTKAPIDVHLMISEPSRYVGEFIDAGADSITFHVEVDEPIEPTLQAIRGRQRAAGLALRPATPLTALEPYRELLDIVMVMTVEPGFGGQSFMKDAARKISPARRLFRDRLFGGEIHVDGGVNRESAELCGGLGVDILVVGTALFKKGHDIGREVRLIKALADEGYAYRRNHGRPPVGRDMWVTFTSLPKAIGKRLAAEIEERGIPVIQLRADGQINPDGVRDYDLLIPATAEPAAVKRFGRAREAALDEAEAWREGLLAGQANGSAAPAALDTAGAGGDAPADAAGGSEAGARGVADEPAPGAGTADVRAQDSR